jgi:cbb3-type cytochrome oxidase subunit 3
MKFINYLSTIAGVDIFPMISLTIFFLFFIALLWHVFTTSKQEVAIMENLPFEQDEQ